ncbi:MAG: 4Fe-4S dicluster domain-containing protein, partial [Chloroflexota bacterium]|nr:4Fe-4S dicluster domain-containing protein [Chloroflexota bacterium]
ACRLCTVEVTEGKRTRLVTACLFPVREGLAVQTSTEQVKRLRRGLMELLLARCPNVPSVQEMARKMGVEKPRFPLGDETCTLCGLCTRACAEIIGRSAISLVSRGVEREVGNAFFEVSQDCVGCGDCVYICPTKCITLGRDGKAVFRRRKGAGYGPRGDAQPAKV